LTAADDKTTHFTEGGEVLLILGREFFLLILVDSHYNSQDPAEQYTE
jgi:hypothetical protein